MSDIFPGILPDPEDREQFEPESSTELSVEEQFEDGDCPWCEYDGGNPLQHAPRAHPDEWAAYKNQEDQRDG